MMNQGSMSAWSTMVADADEEHDEEAAAAAAAAAAADDDEAGVCYSKSSSCARQ